MKSLTTIRTGYLLLIQLLLSVVLLNSLKAQQQIITGTVVEQESNQPVAFANVALLDSSGTTLLGGGAGNYEGIFSLQNVKTGSYKISISAIGYDTFSENIYLNGYGALNMGFIRLASNNLVIDDVTVIANRIKARASTEKTTYFVSKMMHDASNTGTDILRFVPGITIDLQQNISLEGSKNLLILVNGRERNRNFLNQLNAAKIEKIEIMSSPPAGYDASVSGVINIILAKDQDAGFDGHVYAEIPTSESEIFIFPNYSFNYGAEKINLLTSYNGEILCFDITETNRRNIFNNNNINEIITNQHVRQNYWSHRFHYGADFYLNKRNQLNFYGFINPWSQEHNGKTEMFIDGNKKADWSADKEDSDMNMGIFNSLYYKHIFNESTGNEISIDISNYRFTAKNSVEYKNDETGYSRINSSRPEHNSYNVRIDYTAPVSENFRLNTGIQTKLQEMKDNNHEDFQYKDKNYAAYGTLKYSLPRFEVNTGIRFEYSKTGNKDSDQKIIHAFLPNFAANYKLKESTDLKFSFRRSIAWPRLFQLNPFSAIDDPYTVISGNPDLRPGFSNNMALELSFRFGSSYFATRLFYDKLNDVIQNLSQINEDNIYLTRKYNMGTISQCGLQLTGAFNLTKNSGLNAYLKIYELNSTPNEFASIHQIGKRQQLAYETNVSAYINFRKGLSASAILQYTSPVNEIQGKTYSDALYFISLEKQFSKGLKAGISSALPFAGNFTYRGYEVASPLFSSISEGNIAMSAFPVFIKLSYQFQSGQKRNRIERQKEVIENQPRKGF